MRPVGPNGVAILQLIEGLGLEKQTLRTADSSKNRYIWLNNKMEKLPTDLGSLFRSPLTYQLPFLGNDLSFEFKFNLPGSHPCAVNKTCSTFFMTNSRYRTQGDCYGKEMY